MNNFAKVLVVALLTLNAGQLFSAGRDVLTNAYSCCVGNCQQINCQSGTGVGAIGDTRKIDTTNISFKNLGTISATKFVTLALPTEGQNVGYRITFANGSLANKAIEFVGTFELDAGEMVYKFFRRAAGATVFTEVGSLRAGQAISEISPVITPDGVIVSVEDSKIGLMNVGTSKL